MLEISPSAATFISLACGAHDLGEGSGLRIIPSADQQDRHKLRLRYVPGPEPGDVVVDSGDARVFVADEIAPTIAATSARHNRRR